MGKWGRGDWKLVRWIGVASAVLQALTRSVVVKRELTQKAKLLIYWSINISILIYGHKLWVVTKRMRLQLPKLLFSAGMPFSPSWGRFSRHAPLGADPEKAGGIKFLLLAWERIGVPLKELVEVAEEMEVWAFLLNLIHPWPSRWWIDGCKWEKL